MRKYKYQKRKVEYAEGYGHYDKHRKIAVVFFISEVERKALDDLLAVIGAKNQSEFIRGQVFKAYGDLTAEQKRQMAEVAAWRAEDDSAPRR